jgi:hypothetical protein
MAFLNTPSSAEILLSLLLTDAGRFWVMEGGLVAVLVYVKWVVIWFYGGLKNTRFQFEGYI